MQTYLVGGAVRDRLLGLPVSDRDWLVVGATPEEMVRRGYLPVGRDFPVFLHPRTREEHALARTERKSAPGYRGFVVHAAPDVTLEQDLARRDLTINAIALPAEAAELADTAQPDPAALVDPFHGRQDLRDKVLRHVTDAFREDPVRILRVARFAARFHDFRVAPETAQLMREMVDAGEVDALVPERVWQELSRGLLEAMPSRMFAVLQASGALARLLPQVPFAADRMQVIDGAARHAMPLPVRFACLTRGLGPALAALCDRWRVPSYERDLAVLVDREGDAID
ncbi:MAG: multifunctional CCA tRNA nucleotidyl transferase/2'3'-cyclic phosphodiesterase/2'nucleotidase/phosphatase, partial [Comamonadaceae bacterium]